MIDILHLPPALRDRHGLDRKSDRDGFTLSELEVLHIADTVRRHGGNRTTAARELGIHPSTLFRKVKALGIELPSVDGRRRRAR
jgi:DNA-binding NtrC family response regulator